jgi:hypothetical protein
VNPPDGPLKSATWTTALTELEGYLVQLVAAGDSYLVLNVDRSDDVFVQFHASSTLILSAEAAATARCGAACETRHIIGQVAWAAMLRLGWHPPETDPLTLATPGQGHPNFHRQWDSDSGWPPALFSDLAVRTLHGVWGLSPSGIIIRSEVLQAGLIPDRR